MSDQENTAEVYVARDINEALSIVMQNVGYVFKSGKMTGGISYTFASEGDIIRATRPWFVEQGIVMSPADVRDVRNGSYQTAKGGMMNRTSATVVYSFYHAPSGTEKLITVRGEGTDSGDKATPKMMTIAQKYAVRQALFLETGDDPDMVSSDGMERRGKGKKNAKKSAAVPQQNSGPVPDISDLKKYAADNGLDWGNTCKPALQKAGFTGYNPDNHGAMLAILTNIVNSPIPA